jgi:hypothetical protein
MVIQPVTRETFASIYGGGRSYLFDLGTGMYSSGSLPWFEEIYARRGITFDEVFGAAATSSLRRGLGTQCLLGLRARSESSLLPCCVEPLRPAGPSPSLMLSLWAVTMSLP